MTAGVSLGRGGPALRPVATTDEARSGTVRSPFTGFPAAGVSLGRDGPALRSAPDARRLDVGPLHPAPPDP